MGSRTYCVAMFFVMICVICDIGFCRELPEVNSLGGERDVPLNGGEMENIGRFAVQQYNQNQNTLLEFVRVLSAKEQVVSGTIYSLTLEAVDGGQSKKYEAKVWVKPWNNFKQLQEFKPATA